MQHRDGAGKIRFSDNYVDGHQTAGCNMAVKMNRIEQAAVLLLALKPGVRRSGIGAMDP